MCMCGGVGESVCVCGGGVRERESECVGGGGERECVCGGGERESVCGVGG